MSRSVVVLAIGPPRHPAGPPARERDPARNGTWGTRATAGTPASYAKHLGLSAAPRRWWVPRVVGSRLVGLDCHPLRIALLHYDVR